MRLSGIGRLVGLVLGASLAWQGVAQAQSPDDFYKGKTITLLVAAAGGGMADSVARGFANFFQKHIPGQPQIVVVNKPGAGGMVGASQLMTSEQKDGTVIGFLLGNILTTPIVTGKEDQFDPRKVQWIGAVDSGDYPYAVYAFSSSPVQSVPELFEKKMVVGSTSFTNYNRVFPAMLNDYAGAKFEIVSGYAGSGEVYVAMERGEVDGWFEGTQTILKPIGVSGKYIAEGRMKPLLLMASEKSAKFPDIPIAMDYIKDPAQQAVARFILASSAAGRPIAVPAEVPAGRVAILRKAFDDTFADPEFAPYMSGLNLLVEAQTGAKIEQMVAEFYGTPGEILETVRGFMVKK